MAYVNWLVSIKCQYNVNTMTYGVCQVVSVNKMSIQCQYVWHMAYVNC